MTKFSGTTFVRSKLFAEIISRRGDQTLRKAIEDHPGILAFDPIEDLLISPEAWNRVAKITDSPRLVFAHPEILAAAPQTSAYYRGMALLSRKRVTQNALNVTSWEEGKQTSPIRPDKALKVARLYNAVICSIIGGSSDWSLENGYRNILATMGITLDGMFRNHIGDMAEELVKGRLLDWVREHDLVPPGDPPDGVYRLPDNTLMRFGSEPDIAFERDGQLVATIEIKGGEDPAGALERLGAMSKSFAETPSSCINFLIAGVITPEMRSRLDGIGIVKAYELDDMSDEKKWNAFAMEVFHHALRIIK